MSSHDSEGRPKVRRAVSDIEHAKMQKQEGNSVKAQRGGSRSAVARLLTVLVVVVALLASSWAVWRIVDPQSAPFIPDPPEPTETASPVRKTTQEYPLAERLQEAPRGPENYSAEMTKEGVVKDSAQRTVSVVRNNDEDLKVSANSQKCEIKSRDQFCYLGTVEYKSIHPTHVYAFSDIVHSRMFRDAASVEEANTTGAAHSFSAMVQKRDSAVPAFIVINEDSSGFLFMFSGDPSLDEVKKEAQGYVVQESSDDEESSEPKD